MLLYINKKSYFVPKSIVETIAKEQLLKINEKEQLLKINEKETDDKKKFN